MRLAIFSDVHANVVALEAVLRDIRQAAPDALVIAGDLVLSGPRPAETLALLRSLRDAHFVMGNCDAYVVDPAEQAADVCFVRERLSSDDLAFLAGLPLTQSIEIASGRNLLVCHANPLNLEDPIKPELDESLVRPLFNDVTADLVAFGHYHVPFVRSLAPWTLVDVASVGIPRDGDRRAVWAMVAYERGSWSVEHRRVVYDWDAVAHDYTAVGFPNARHAAASLLRARY